MELGRLPEIIITFYIVSSLLIPPHSPLVVDKLPRLLDAQAPVGQEKDADDDDGDAGGYGGGDIGDAGGNAGGDDEKRLLVKPFSTTAVLNGSANRNATCVAMKHDT